MTDSCCEGNAKTISQLQEQLRALQSQLSALQRSVQPLLNVKQQLVQVRTQRGIQALAEGSAPSG